ncbi:MAG: hypothetical protein ACNA7Q_02880 [Rhodobacterales bacterium]
MRPISLKLPEPLLRAAVLLAQDRDCSLGALIRHALNAEIKRAGSPAKTPNRADERLVDPLRALLAVDFGEARNWPDLQHRLAIKGFTLREAGGGLALHSHPDGARLCKASELGHAYASLMRRFGKPFPHPGQSWLESQVIQRKAPLPDQRQRGGSGGYSLPQE